MATATKSRRKKTEPETAEALNEHDEVKSGASESEKVKSVEAPAEGNSDSAGATLNEAEQLGETPNNSETAPLPAADFAVVGVFSSEEEANESHERATAADAAEPPHVPPVATATAPLPDDPSTPEALSLYDAETVRGANDRNHECDACEGEHEEAKKAAKEAKEAFDAAVDRLRKWQTDREANRGKRVTVQLELPFEQTEADGWRELPISAGHFTVEMMSEFRDAKIETLGQLFEWLESPADDATKCEQAMHVELDAAIKRWESQQKATDFGIAKLRNSSSTDPLDELWREFPITGWKEFGITDTDVKKLAEGTVKRDNSTFPIRTVGDLNRFVTPNPAMPDFARNYGDVKGIGPGGVDRISEAETKFWASWNGGLKEKFATEKGLMPTAAEVAQEQSNESTPEAGGEVPGDAPAAGEPVEREEAGAVEPAETE